jgi:hypothetical protein
VQLPTVLALPHLQQQLAAGAAQLPLGSVAAPAAGLLLWTQVRQQLLLSQTWAGAKVASCYHQST